MNRKIEQEETEVTEMKKNNSVCSVSSCPV